jgi:hypothetical protein
MNLRGLVGAPKTVINPGVWKNGEIPRSQWPSRRAKAKAYKYGPRYQWRVITFVAKGYDCRVLLLFNETKQIFRARFGVTLNGETVPICDYEWHASEPGWHCHAKCDDLGVIDPASNRFGSKRLPRAGEFHRRGAFKFRKHTLTAQIAFNCAVSVFKIDKKDDAL